MTDNSSTFLAMRVVMAFMFEMLFHNVSLCKYFLKQRDRPSMTARIESLKLPSDTICNNPIVVTGNLRAVFT